MVEQNEVVDAVASQGPLLLASLLLALALVFVRYLILHYWYAKLKRTSAERRKARSASRGVVIAFLVFGMAIIWAPELQAFAFSLAAFAVALVVGMKELILTALGGFYRLITGAYKVGDWVRIGTVRGEVVDVGLTSTTLEELGPGLHGSSYTGLRIVLPNSKLLIDSVYSETQVGPYLLHTITVPFNVGDDVVRAQKKLLEVAMAAVDQTDLQFKKFEKNMAQFLDISNDSLKPKIQYHFHDAHKCWIELSLFLPVVHVEEKEREIVTEYLMWLHETGVVTPCPESD